MNIDFFLIQFTFGFQLINTHIKGEKVFCGDWGNNFIDKKPLEAMLDKFKQ